MSVQLDRLLKEECGFPSATCDVSRRLERVGERFVSSTNRLRRRRRSHLVGVRIGVANSLTAPSAWVLRSTRLRLGAVPRQ